MATDRRDSEGATTNGITAGLSSSPASVQVVFTFEMPLRQAAVQRRFGLAHRYWPSSRTWRLKAECKDRCTATSRHPFTAGKRELSNSRRARASTERIDHEKHSGI